MSPKAESVRGLADVLNTTIEDDEMSLSRPRRKCYFGVAIAPSVMMIGIFPVVLGITDMLSLI